MEYLSNLTDKKEAMHWLDEAAKFARKSLCLNRKCGTVIVKNGEIVGGGYNAPPRDNPKFRTCLDKYKLPQKFRFDRTCCIHAEWRAIKDALKQNQRKLSGSRLYFIWVDKEGNKRKSGKPYCTVCSRMALDADIAEFVLWHEGGICVYPTDEYNRLSYHYFKGDW